MSIKLKYEKGKKNSKISKKIALVLCKKKIIITGILKLGWKANLETAINTVVSGSQRSDSSKLSPHYGHQSESSLLG